MDELHIQDPEVFAAIEREVVRQNDGIELIASENSLKRSTLCVFYTYETNLSDGWEAPGVHPNDSPKTRLNALQMGVNVLVYAMMSPNPPVP